MPAAGQHRFRQSTTEALPESTGASDMVQSLRDALMGHSYLRQATVLANAGELPQAVQSDLLKKALDPLKVKGVYFQGQSYLVAANIADIEDGLRTALHEVVAHEGIRALLTDRFEPVMLDVYATFPREHDAWKTVANRYGYLDTGTYAGKIAFAEEITAHLAEENSEVGELDMVHAEIRAQLRKEIPDLPVTDTEVKALIQRSRESLLLRHGNPVEIAEVQERQELRKKAASHMYQYMARAGDGVPDAMSLSLYQKGCRVVDKHGIPSRLYHGAGAPIDTVNGTFWGSVDPSHASDYAGMRLEQGGAALVLPYYADIKRPFDGDALKDIRTSFEKPDGLSINVFIEEVIRQGNLIGDGADSLRAHAAELNRLRRREESGPSYSPHDFWYMPHWSFGNEGAALLQTIYQTAGFDGVRYTELGNLTYGAFTPSQLHFLDQGATPHGLVPDHLEGEAKASAKALERWFGDSKVVDNEGRPLTVYNGTNAEFTVFNTDDRSLDLSIPNNLGDNIGSFFAANKNHAKDFGQQVSAYHLKLENPKEFSTQQEFRDFIRETSGRTPDIRDSDGYITDEGVYEHRTREVLEAQGYDGVIITRPHYTKSKSSDRPWFIAFYPEQIKSAENNRGTFDINNPDVRFNLLSGQPVGPTLKNGQTNSLDAFKQWFDQSAVVDSSGAPLKVYSGTPDIRGIIQNGFAPSPTRGEVYFFSDNYAVADTYADDQRAFDFQNAEPYTAPFYLAMQNPYEIDAKGQKWRNTEQHIQEAKGLGHDGIVIRNSRDEYNNTGNGGRLSTVFAVFDTQKIASAEPEAQLYSRIDGKPLGTLAALMPYQGAQVGQNTDIQPSSLLDESPTAKPSAFRDWFGNSKVVAPDGTPQKMFHGTVNDIVAFDQAKIRKTDLDAVSNGFWFSSSAHTTPATQNAKIVMPVYLAIDNPAPYTLVKQVARQARIDGIVRSDARSNDDEVRYRLQEMGYDGFFFAEPTRLTAEQRETFARTGEVTVSTNRGGQLNLRHETHRVTELIEHSQDVEVLQFTNAKGRQVTVSLSQPDDAQVALNIAQEGVFSFFNSDDINLALAHIKALRSGTVESVVMGDTTLQRITQNQMYPEWVETGEVLDIVQLYTQEHGHITGYSSLDDFESQHSELVAVAFQPGQIKSAIANRGSFDANNPDIRFSFAGEQADTADLLALGHAQDRLERGDDPEQVRQDTGWFQGPDNRWRFEISDEHATLAPAFLHLGEGELWGEVYDQEYMRLMVSEGRGLRLGDLMDHPRLYAAYPALAALNISDLKGPGPSAQLFNGDGSEPPAARIHRDLPLADVLSELHHELQHRIQFIERFAAGGTPLQLSDQIDNLTELASQDSEELARLMAQAKETAISLLAKSPPSAFVQEHLNTWQKLVGEQGEDNPYGLTRARAIQLALISEDLDYQALFNRYRKADQLAALTPLDMYQRLYGEIEARNVQSRLSLRDGERRERSPADTQDFDSEDAIVLINGDVALDGLAPANGIAATTERRNRRPSRDTSQLEEPEIRYSFVGEKAYTANKHALEYAQSRLERGDDPEQVRQSTGWHKAVDGRWRFEIDDSEAKLLPTLETLKHGTRGETRIRALTYQQHESGQYTITLTPENAQVPADFIELVDFDREMLEGLLPENLLAQIGAGEGEDEWGELVEEPSLTIHTSFTFPGIAALALDKVLDHPRLFAAYPAIRNVMVKVKPELGAQAQTGLTLDEESYIALGAYRQLNNLLHEGQHLVQLMEGFASGGSARDTSLPTRTQLEKEIREPFDRKIKAIERSPEYIGWVSERELAAGKFINSRGSLVQAQVYEITLAANDHFGISELESQRHAALLRLIDQGAEGGFLQPRYTAYLRLAGEIEARNVQARQRLTTEQRRATPPATSQDIPDQDAIVLFNGLEAANLPSPKNIKEHQALAPKPAKEAAFKAWFADSRVVDDSGQPKKVYKGMYPYDWESETPDSPKGQEITAIKRTSPLPAFNGDEPGIDIAGFFGDISTANHFAALGMSGAVYPVYLSLQHPYEVDAKGELAGNIQFGESGKTFRAAMRSGRYDGAILHNTSDEGTVYITTRADQAKSIFNTGAYSPSNTDMRFSFAGESARSADRLTLDYAKRALSAGIHPGLVFEHTGWEQGKDGHWRFEIDDSAARMAPLMTSSSNTDAYIDWIEEAGSRDRGVPLTQVLIHPDLFDAYPILKTYRVKVVDKAELGNCTAAFDRDNRVVKMIDPFDMRMREDGLDPALSVLMHELQHGLQDLENFAQGGRPSEVGTVLDAAAFEEIVNRHDALLASPEAQRNSARFDQLRKSWKGRSDIPEIVVEEIQALKTAPIARELAKMQSQVMRMVKNQQFGGTAYNREELFDGYQRLAGEVEARNVQSRVLLTAEERRTKPPETTEDYPRDRQLLVDAVGKHFLAPNERMIQLSRIDTDERKVINATQSGAALQAAATDMLDILDANGLQVGWLDGGCRIWAEALRDWSDGKIMLGVTSRDGENASHAVGVLSLGSDPGSPSALLDADGLTTPEGMIAKLALLELSHGEQLVAIGERAEQMVQSLPMDEKATSQTIRTLELALGTFKDWEEGLQKELAIKYPEFYTEQPKVYPQELTSTGLAASHVR